MAFKKIRSQLEARIIYEDLDGECHIQTPNGMSFSVLVIMPDDSGVWYENDDGEEIFTELTNIYLTEESYNYMLEIKQRKGW